VTSDPISEQEWRGHQIWLRIHQHRELERARWTTRDWQLVRERADVAWELNPEGVYLYKALKACEDVHWCWAKRWLR
jgi:hypothetical protein